MKLHDLKPNPGSKKDRTRVGRGISAGKGKTAGRGTKGQRSRSGFGGNLYRQGGNLPFYRRLPFMRGEGFTPPNQVEYNEVNIETLAEKFKSGAEVSPETLAEMNLLHKKLNPVVVLGRGTIDKPLTVKVQRVTKSAREKIEAAGGKVEIVS
ncbi:MAG TPA: 50S ribosomal protein L15 [Anaerolineaceae bacterium]|uniref:Large ribosomal subunit protein uL15 n=1 Tax=Anaerolinea thermophila TaxID=167964 RepID=A0A101FZ30_9CHLR|nr:MAG: 50S ribosomal protein L15 [Anaerolinea thermophila]HAF62934.1 50S ribosomal protein L15 [Anaerolineaceae bacterium]